MMKYYLTKLRMVNLIKLTKSNLYLFKNVEIAINGKNKIIKKRKRKNSRCKIKRLFSQLKKMILTKLVMMIIIIIKYKLTNSRNKTKKKIFVFIYLLLRKKSTFMIKIVKNK